MLARRQFIYRWLVISVGWVLAILLVPQLDLRNWLGIIFLLVVSAAAESTTIPLPYGGLTTPNFVAFYVTLFIYGPAEACWVAICASFLVDRVWRRRRTFIFLLNGALYVVAVLATNHTFLLLGGTRAALSAAHLIPLTMCAAVYFLVNNTMVYVYYALQRGFSLAGWWEFVKWDGLGHIMLAPIAVLIVLTYLALGVPAAQLFLPIVLGAWYALEVNIEVGISNRSLAVMYRIDKSIATILDLEELGGKILDAVRTVAKYEHVSLWVMDEEGKKLVFRTGMGCSKHVPEGFSIAVGEGIIGWVAETGEPLLVPDIYKDPRHVAIEGQYGVASEVVVPLSAADRVVGVLAVADVKENAFTEEEAALLATVAGRFAITIENAILHQQVERLAITDPLTGAHNRRYLEQKLDYELERARRYNRPVSVLVMDIDKLKLFNDTYGHQGGDKVIRTVAQVILTSCRKADVVGRYGGDEFAAILPEADTQNASRAAEKILVALKKESFQSPDGTKVPISISIGAASYPSDSDEAGRLFSLADASMYRVKVSGGGQFASLILGPEEGPEDVAAPFDVLQALLLAIDSKDRYTFDHSQKVTRYALALARAAGLSGEEIKALEIAGQFHDVGKIGIPAGALRKPGALTHEEWEIVREHPRLGYLILQQLPRMETVLQAVLHHHERYDGNGYPSGLQGENIPLLSRILSVADAFSAMTTDRPYRKALTVAEALDELRGNAGKQFDAELAHKFIELVEKGKITALLVPVAQRAAEGSSPNQPVNGGRKR